MVNDEFDSNLMRIEIRGTTVLYAYKDAPTNIYAIREVNLFDLSKLKQTHRNAAFSSSATVQYLTHLYEHSHFAPDGSKAPPASQSKKRLLKLTPYRAVL